MNPPMTHHPIVVGYDGSPSSEAALQWAARAADRRGLGLLIMHAAERITYTQDAGSGLWQVDDIIAEAKDVAERGRQTVLETFPDLPVDTAGSLFSAKVALGELSTSTPMTVLGSHGRSRIATMLLGSTAYAIAGYARSPVVIVRDGHTELPGPGQPVVVGVSNTRGSERAVDAGAELAREWDASLLLATTWTPAPPDPFNTGPIGYRSAEEASEAYEGQAKRANQDALERARSLNPDLDIDGTVIQAHPVEGLVEIANHQGILILGARVHTLAAAVLGSTSLGVLHQGSVPIMIVD